MMPAADPSPGHSPSRGRRRLRLALRRAREAAGFTQEQVAAAMDWSLSKIIRIEAGTVSVSTNDTKALLAYYRVDEPAQVGHLVELARAARRRTWWSAYRERLPAPFFSYIGLEADAVSMRMFRPMGVPGLLQSPSYARAVTAGAAPMFLAPGAAEERIALRMRRQSEVLGRAVPPSIDVVLDEVNLHRRLGGTPVLIEQLRHLLDLGERRVITLRVLPFTAEEYMVVDPFIILGFAGGEDDAIAYLEGTDTQQLVEDPALVSTYTETFGRLCDISLSPAESAAMIVKRVQELAGPA